MNHLSRIAHYQITAKLGEGGMGEVYRAVDTKLDREVAVKIISAAVADAPERLARFVREAKVLASLNHPNIATIFGVEERALVMELIEGDTLVDLIRRGPVPVEQAVRIAAEMVDALEYAHAHGVIHRDLKPANVKVNCRVKVLDFGLAKVQKTVDQSDDTITCATQVGMILGTAAYMSPEQASGKTADVRSDIFSFGVILYEMLSGQRAFSEETPISTIGAILHKQPRALREIAPHVPAELEAIVVRCMAKDPADRFAGMNLIKQALKDLPPVSSFLAAPVSSAQNPGNGRFEQSQSFSTSLNSLPLEEVSRKLAVYLGPVAKFVVKKLAAQCCDLDTIYREASKQIASDADRAAFLRSKHQ
jgi:serine/threonine-protein kinase